MLHDKNGIAKNVGLVQPQPAEQVQSLAGHFGRALLSVLPVFANVQSPYYPITPLMEYTYWKYIFGIHAYQSCLCHMKFA